MYIFIFLIMLYIVLNLLLLLIYINYNNNYRTIYNFIKKSMLKKNLKVINIESLFKVFQHITNKTNSKMY